MSATSLTVSEYLRCLVSAVVKIKNLSTQPAKICRVLETLADSLNRMSEFALSERNILVPDAQISLGHEISKVLSYFQPLLCAYFGQTHPLWSHINGCLFDLYTELSNAPFIDEKTAPTEVSFRYEPPKGMSDVQLASIKCDWAAVKHYLPLPPSQFDDYELRCAMCQEKADKLLKCGACHRVRYCDAVCQKNHWKWHKNDCKKFK